MNRQNFHKVLLGAALLLLLLWGISQSTYLSPNGNDTNTPEQTASISYRGIEGRTALELLKTKYNVETQEFTGLGEFVTAIDGVASNSSNFWAFYINGEQAQVGAGSYITKSTDLIEWRLEEIK